MSNYSRSSLRSPLGRVRALGSARHGAMHWWTERLTSLALIPLCLWFVISLLTTLLGTDAQGVAAWLSSSFTALLLAALTLIGFIHTKMGLQVVIEDYIHSERKKIATTLFKDTCCYALMALALAGIAKLHFIGL